MRSSRSRFGPRRPTTAIGSRRTSALTAISLAGNPSGPAAHAVTVHEGHNHETPAHSYCFHRVLVPSNPTHLGMDGFRIEARPAAKVPTGEKAQAQSLPATGRSRGSPI